MLLNVNSHSVVLERTFLIPFSDYSFPESQLRWALFTKSRYSVFSKPSNSEVHLHNFTVSLCSSGAPAPSLFSLAPKEAPDFRFTDAPPSAFKTVACPLRFSPRSGAAERGSPVSGKKGAAGLVCTESWARAASPEVWTGSWAAGTLSHSQKPGL